MQNSKKYIYTVIVLGILNLFLLYYSKYSTNHLSITELDLTKTGNFINLVLTIMLVLGSILLLFSKSKVNEGHYKLLLVLSVIYLIPLIILIIINSINVEFAQDYLFGYPFKKIIPVIFYIINQSLFIFVLFMVWYIYFGHSFSAYIYSMISTILMIVFILAVSLTRTYFVNEKLAEEEKFEYGIILGAAVWSGNKPSPLFTGRIEKGAKLFLGNVVNKLQVTGGNAPGEVSEAKAAYNYLVEKFNIPDNKIFIEEVTSTTNEQIRFIKKRFAKEHNKSEFLFISDKFHLQRISEMADFYDLNAKVVSSEGKLNFQKSLYYRLRDSIGLVLFWFFAI